MLLLLNLGEFKSGNLIVRADRAGLVSETIDFLADIESAYVALLQLESTIITLKARSRFLPAEFWQDIGFTQIGRLAELDSTSLLPEFRLHLQRVRIESPGFWEFLGAINPLQQIREYLKDRHARKQDKDFRNDSEADRLRLENELIQRSIWKSDNSILRERIEILRELGHSDTEIRQMVWSIAGMPLAKLGTHQDTQMISDVE